MFEISDVLSSTELSEISKLLERDEAWADGRASATGVAREVKRNLEAVTAPPIEEAKAIIRQALLRHELFDALCLPKSFPDLLFSRYVAGMAYGEHMDSPTMNGQRVDLSFTLFLSDLDSYEGGELVIADNDCCTAVKLPRGGAVIYPTGAPHSVNLVTSGVRLAAVGWVRSYVRRSDFREMLFDLAMAEKDILDRLGRTPAYDRVLKTRANLLRAWADD